MLYDIKELDDKHFEILAKYVARQKAVRSFNLEKELKK